MRKSLLFTISLVLFAINYAYSQSKNESPRDLIEEKIAKQIEVYPQEKLHLHLDRDCYVPGEKNWFRAYLVDAANHTYPTESKFVYVELINSSDSLISRVMVRPIDDMHYGHIFLSEVIPQGVYTIRAYTKYMENLGDDYFFKKNIYIENTNTETINKPNSKKQKLKKHDYDVTFYPEGGNLLDGTLCRVAFKALNENGYSEKIEGKVVDGRGNKIVEVKTFHAGMGIFSFIPEMNKKYFLECTNSNIYKRFELPDIVVNGHSLFSYWRDNKLIVSILKSASINRIETSYLLIHSKGNVLFFDKWDNNKKYISFSNDQLPSGILQILLLDRDLNCLSERLVFSKNIDPIRLSFSTDKKSYKPREKVLLNLKACDHLMNPLISSLSIAITDNKDISTDNNNTIFSSLLLSSELKGHIESPGYYFDEHNPKSNIALDYLMLTHGWRRYNIPNTLKGDIQYPFIPFEKKKSISGSVKSLIRSKPIPNSEVSMIAMNKTLFGVTVSNESGQFIFDDLDIQDSTTIYIQSLTSKKSDRVELLLDSTIVPPIKSLKKHILYTNSVDLEINDTKSSFLIKANERSKYDEQMRMVYLKNIDVIASKMAAEDINLPWYSVGASNTINREYIEKITPRHITDILMHSSGVYVKENGVYIRGNNRSTASIYIDGYLMSYTDLMYFPVGLVERIDIYKGPNAAIFGANASNGVISVLTKRPSAKKNEIPSFNSIVLNPLGYQKPIEFYSPKYETIESKTSEIPDLRTTVFWKPDIVTDEKGEASIDFYTSDYLTTYSVVIEGISFNGEIIRKVDQINVE